MTQVCDSETYSKMLDRMEHTGYFTNHGPMAQAFENAMSEIFGMREAVAVSHYFVAALMVSVGLGTPLSLRGRGNHRLHAAQSILNVKQHGDGLLHSNTEIAFYSLDLKEPEDRVLANSIQSDKNSPNDTRNVVFINNPFENTELTKKLVSSNFACILSHEDDEKLSTFSGATITSSSPQFLNQMRNIRSSYGVKEQLSVAVTSNGRFAETQAILGLEGLKKLGLVADY